MDELVGKLMEQDVFKPADPKDVKKREAKRLEITGRKKVTFEFDFWQLLDDQAIDALNGMVDDKLPEGAVASEITYRTQSITPDGVITIEAEYTPEQY